ncbi:hypothetical protein [Planobispora takensis]|uniref:Uncharacterized protein n=1 Tax=Planobispora takensis TaxID=1367882 RepID=A0A8J3SY23_9ACTN|nr:hypothetical protein [Planobispora takensis]GII02759.1 hypothetical protein Pta02_47670 [Planobispora takensis]
MIPESLFDLELELPEEAAFWLPSADPKDEGDGLGYFDSTWSIRDIATGWAFDVLRTELGLARLVDEAARDRREFEMLASAVECPDAENVDRIEFGHLCEELMDEITSDVPPGLGGLELGVAGLVHALTAYGCVPAASCRGHVYDLPRRPWSDRPVVYFASEREGAERLVPLVRVSGCGFNFDPDRPRLILIEAPSITEMMRLAEKILIATPSGLSADQRLQLSDSRNGPRDPDQLALW